MNDLYFLNGHCWFKDILLIFVSGKLSELLLGLIVYLINLLFFLGKWLHHLWEKKNDTSFSLCLPTPELRQLWPSATRSSSHLWNRQRPIPSTPTVQMGSVWTTALWGRYESFLRMTRAYRHFFTKIVDLSNHSSNTERFPLVPCLQPNPPPSAPHCLPPEGPPSNHALIHLVPTGLNLWDSHHLWNVILLINSHLHWTYSRPVMFLLK